MRLPKDLLAQTYKRPRLFLCEVDKTKICELEPTSMSGSFKFNAYSELTFTVGRTYTNMITGETDINPFYDKIQALRLVYLDGFGYFEIQEPEIVSDGIREAKNITAYGYEYTLAQKYLENFDINTGEIGSIDGVVLYNYANKDYSLLDIILEKIYGWKIGHVDTSLQTMSRQFEISRVSVYDFIVQDICEKFNCFAVFDTVDNTINLYSEALVSKFIGNGESKSFTLSTPYSSIGSVSINSYKTTEYKYNTKTGEIVFTTAPGNGTLVEVTDGSQEQWMTDVYVTFDNLAQEINISYSADDIKTVLTVKGADDLGIREVNMGLPYLVDISYYYSVDWMGQELYDAYTKYLQNSEAGQVEYQNNSSQMWEIEHYISYEENRLSLQYSIADNVTSTTVGTYYVRGGEAPDYYYSEVKLPDEYNSNIEHYYTISGADIDKEKFSDLYEGLKKYFLSEDEKDVSEIEAQKDSFAFMETYTIDYLVTALSNATSLANKNTAIANFLGEVWEQLGRTPLKSMFYEPYKIVKETNESAGWNDVNNENYWAYYPVTIVISTLEQAISERDSTISAYEKEYSSLQIRNGEIADDALIYNNFTDEQLIRLTAFLREDEYTDDNFFETESDSIETLMQTKHELMECGRIELQKLCEPKLEFSMDMANIYAIPEFEPIIDQFQLGNLIRVELRNDYIKRARLLSVDINFDDFSDFTCEFGELTSLRTPSSIHADLLASALTAGKSVASNSSYWDKGADTVTELALQIRQGLLDAATVIKAIDGHQGVSIDKYGIHLQKIDPETGVIDPKEGWIVNNQFLYSDDNFQTVKSVFGEYTANGQTLWGLIAEAVQAGYVVGCTIEGGTIKIGKQADGTYAFEVREDGTVIMNGGNTIAGYAKEEDLNDLKNTATIISDEQPSDANEGQLWLNTSTEPYTLMIFTNGKWKYFSQQDGETIYITRPESYNMGDLWIVSENDLYNSCPIVNEDPELLLEKIWNGLNEYYTKDGKNIAAIRYYGYEEVENGDVGDYTTQENGDLNYNIYTSYNELPDPAVIYHPSFFDDAGFNLGLRNDSITIYGTGEKVLASQDHVKYYGTNNTVIIDPVKISSELFLIYSNGQIYLLDRASKNTFFCDMAKSGAKHVNGTLLRAIESSSTFNYDHWIDISTKETELQNNINQNFTFNKKTGLTIGQADQKFYVNIKSVGMEICENPNVEASTENVKLDPNRVVLISNNSAEIENATFDGSNGTTFNNNSTFNQQVNLMGFIFKKEQNGSLSLALDL